MHAHCLQITESRTRVTFDRRERPFDSTSVIIAPFTIDNHFFLQSIHDEPVQQRRDAHPNTTADCDREHSLFSPALALGALSTAACGADAAAARAAASHRLRESAAARRRPRHAAADRHARLHLDRRPDDDGGARPDQGGQDDGADPDRRHRGERSVPDDRQAQQRAARDRRLDCAEPGQRARRADRDARAGEPRARAHAGHRAALAGNLSRGPDRHGRQPEDPGLHRHRPARRQRRQPQADAGGGRGAEREVEGHRHDRVLRARVLQLRRGREIRAGGARHPREDRGAARRLLHLRDHRGARPQRYPRARAHEGRQVRHQRRQPRRRSRRRSRTARKIVAFRTEKTVAAIRKAMAAAR